MSNTSISLLDEIKKGGFEASLITTFNAYLPFYEDVVLRKLVSAGARHNVLMIDAGQCAQSVANHPPYLAGRHYALVPMQSAGAFHPKVILLVGKNKGVLIVGSHNLTLSGFGYNREVTNIVRYFKSDPDEATQTTIVDVWTQIKGWMSGQTNLPDHLVEMVNNVTSFAPWMKQDKSNSDDCFVISSQPGKPSLWSQLNNLVEGKARKVIVLGAFFDSQFRFVKKVQNDLSPQELIVGIEPDTVQMPDNAQQLSDVRFVNCKKLPANSDDAQLGYLHAKSIVIENDEGQWLLASGSANPSAPAWLGEGLSQNVEMMLVRKGDEAKAAAEEMGLLEIPNMPTLGENDWELAQKNWDKHDDIENSQVAKVGIAIAGEEEIVFQIDQKEKPDDLTCNVLDAEKTTIETSNAVLRNGKYHLKISDKTIEKVYCLQCRLDGDRPLILLIHFANLILEQSRTSSQRRFREALASLNSDTPDVETLISCVDKIIFSKVWEIDRVAPKPQVKVGLSRTGEENAEDENGGRSLSVDLSETQKSKKKFRLQHSNDLAYLLDTLIYYLRVDIEENLVSQQDSKGRTEEEQVGSDDADFETLIDDDPAQRVLELCQGKVRTLVNRIINQFDALRNGKVGLADVVVRMTGVLAFLRHLRKCDGKVYWIKPGQTAFPQEQRGRLLRAIREMFFDGKFSIISQSEKTEKISDSDELARLKGLIIWLAWDCGVELKLKKPFFEIPENQDKRMVSNAMMIALAQLVNADDIVAEEAKKSIAPFCFSDMDWLNWILSADRKLQTLSLDPDKYADGTKAKPGDLAFHPNLRTLGMRVVLRSGNKYTQIVSFVPEKNYVAYLSSFIRVIPLGDIMPEMSVH